MQFFASISNDLVVALPFTHNSIGPTLPKPTPVVSLDLPTTQKWLTNSSCKFTKKVTHKSCALALMDHDVGPFVPHLTLPPSPLMALQTLTSSRKSMIYARKILGEGKPLIASCGVGNLDCGDPFKNPMVANATFFLNTLRPAVDERDLINAFIAICREYLIDVLSKIFEKILDKMSFMESCSDFYGKIKKFYVAIGGYSIPRNIFQMLAGSAKNLPSGLKYLAAGNLRASIQNALAGEIGKEIRKEIIKKLNPLSASNRAKTVFKLFGEMASAPAQGREADIKVKLGIDLTKMEIVRLPSGDSSNPAEYVNLGLVGMKPASLPNQPGVPTLIERFNAPPTAVPRAPARNVPSARSIGEQLARPSAPNPGARNLGNTGHAAPSPPSPPGACPSASTLPGTSSPTSVPSQYSSMPPLPVVE
jgi:hypothetical protein